MEKIYITHAISLENKTEESLKKEYEIKCLKYNKKFDWNCFLKILKQTYEDKYSIGGFISGFYNKKEEATYAIVNNIGDINEAGCYPYAAVCTADIGVAYYDSYQNIETDFDIYEYNFDSKKYEPLNKEADEYKAILHYIWGYV